jgi:catecholate siderophore receptor
MASSQQIALHTPSPFRPAVGASGIGHRPDRARALLATTALALVLACTGAPPVCAQATGAKPIELPPISVEGAQPSEGTEYKTDAPTLPKLTEPLRDTPQSITVVPRQYVEDRGVTNLNDAVRYVPGISIAAGEGGSQGSSMTLRGFSSRNDIFLDGMRDFGSYYRDPFNMDGIEVLKGPSSMLFGRGSTGGVVNQASKSPLLGSLTGGSLIIGTDNTKRATADINRALPELGQGAAFRLNVMGHDSQVADRDVGEYRRFGFAPSLALGLGTPTRLTFSYFHQSEDDVPDYGLPFLFGTPAPVDRHNFYGFKDDFLRTDADVATAKIEHDINDAITLRDQIRYAHYTRDARITEPQIPGSVTASTPLSSITINRNQIAVSSVETFLENQTDATARFKTGFLDHTVVTGIEIGRETSSPRRFTWTGVPGTSLLSPNPDQPFAGTSSIRSNVDTTATTLGVYVVDTVKLSPQWEVTGGVRWDRFDANYEESVAGTAFSRVDEMPSWRGAVVYKPAPNGSIYISYGTSFNPSAESLSLSSTTANLPPEENKTYEIGTKWDVFAERLSLRGAVFRSEKTNARVPDPNNPLLNVLGGKQRVDGFEIEATGRLTEHWQVFSGYAYMDGSVIDTAGATTGVQPGAPLQNTPKHTLHVWTTYDLPWRTQVGAGVNYVSSRVARNSTVPYSVVPDYWTVDAMAKYHLTDKIDIQLNIINLTDERYIDQIHPAHIVPGAGRTVLVGTNVTF